MRRVLVFVIALAALVTAGVVRATSPAPALVRLSVELPDNPTVGARLFAEKQCVRCHALGGSQAGIGPDLGRIHFSGTVLDVAGAFWNHAPVMREKMRDLKIQPPVADERRDGGHRRVRDRVSLLPDRARRARQSRARPGGLQGQAVHPVPQRGRQRLGEAGAESRALSRAVLRDFHGAGHVEPRPADGADHAASAACPGRSSPAARWAICWRTCRPATKAS